MINLILLSLISICQVFSSGITIDDFEQPAQKTTDKLLAPINWSEGSKKNGKLDYYIVQEKGDTFLRGEYLQGTTAKVIYLKKQIKLKDNPYLSWKWRAKKFPVLQSIDGVEEPDNVATVYVLFKKGWSNYLIKYDWSQFNCKTTEDGKPFYFKSRSSAAFWLIYIKPTRCTNNNIKCCSDPTDKWVSEKVNLIEDFKLLFKKDWLPEYIEGIGVLVDGDNTNTVGVSADFDDFILSSE
ncbi:MAG: DUF3047 domain-containing protein [Proteobacteria bacterium]|nr:DUF3047 domain-containing protein [Pseudomonadota bacterium]